MLLAQRATPTRTSHAARSEAGNGTLPGGGATADAKRRQRQAAASQTASHSSKEDAPTASVEREARLQARARGSGAAERVRKADADRAKPRNGVREQRRTPFKCKLVICTDAVCARAKIRCGESGTFWAQNGRFPLPRSPEQSENRRLADAGFSPAWRTAKRGWLFAANRVGCRRQPAERGFRALPVEGRAETALLGKPGLPDGLRRVACAASNPN